MYRPNVLKARIEAGERVYGAWVGGGSPATAELMGHVGFDFLVRRPGAWRRRALGRRGRPEGGRGLGHALHGAGTLERPDLAQADPGCRRAVGDDPLGRDRGSGPGGGGGLPLPAAGCPRLRRRGDPRLDLRARARLRRQGQRQPAARPADRIGRRHRARGRDLRGRGRGRGVHRRQRPRGLDRPAGAARPPGRAQPGQRGWRTSSWPPASPWARSRVPAPRGRSCSRAATAWWSARTTSSCCARPPVPAWAEYRRFRGEAQDAPPVPKTASY